MGHPLKRKRHKNQTSPLNFTSRFNRSAPKESTNYSSDEELKRRWLETHQITRLEPAYSQYGFGPLPVKAT